LANFLLLPFDRHGICRNINKIHCSNDENTCWEVVFDEVFGLIVNQYYHWQLCYL